jgi:ADP-ribose pyrophosphatase YjhB (NUDIX family)
MNYMIERVNVAGGVILNGNDEVLLVYNRMTDSWTYPKGHVNENEDFLETAKREIVEEAGLRDLKLVCEFPVYERATRQKKNKVKVMHMFLFMSQNEEAQSNTNDITNIKWVPIDEVVDYFSYPEEVDFFNGIKDKLVFQA